MKPLRLKSPAKLNLYLRVLNKRPDGYHDIVTLFEKIDLCDDIVITAMPAGINVVCRDPDVPKGPQNIAYKAANALLDYTGKKTGARINILKRIPVGAGLGGGSSNAATVLKGLNRLWKLKLGQKELARIGSKLGADVSFFLLSESMALGTGRGERLEPIKPVRRLWHVLVTPKNRLLTRQVYEIWDRIAGGKARGKIPLTAAVADVKILHHSIQKNDIISLGKSLHNDLEQAARVKDSTIIKIKELLRSCGAKAVLMSGSGSTVFGIVLSRKEAMGLKRRLDRLKGDWQVFLAKTY